MEALKESEDFSIWLLAPKLIAYFQVGKVPYCNQALPQADPCTVEI